VQKNKAVSPLENELLSQCDSESRMLQILDSLSDDERKALEIVFDKMRSKNSDASTRSTRVYSYQWLAKTLTKHGHPVTKYQVRAYLNRTKKKQS
jgi:hypothetical protein